VPTVDHPNIPMWVPSNSNCPLPFGAVSVGIDKDGSRLYAGRAHHQGDLLPAKINPNHISAYVCWGGLEHAKNDYEVLCNENVMWESFKYNCIPSNAIEIGYTVQGDKLYMGRIQHDGALTPGKIHIRNRALFLPYAGKEVTIDVAFNMCEIMVKNNRTLEPVSVYSSNMLLWIPFNSASPFPEDAIQVGIADNNDKLYAGRAFHGGDLLPAYINANEKKAFVGWGGKEHGKWNFEVLCSKSVAWQAVQGSHIPSNAVVMGSTVNNEKLYMGRKLHNGKLIPGKIHPSKGLLYIPYSGSEHIYRMNECEILINYKNN